MIETKIVYCKKHGKHKHPFIELEDCKKCEFHNEVKQVFVGQNGLPDKFVVLCALPVQVPIGEFVQGINDQGGPE